MANNWLYPIKVEKNVKALHSSKRTQVQLIIGCRYYFSFGENIVSPCTLVEIFEDGDKTPRVTIEVKIKAPSKRGFRNEFGRISQTQTNRIHLYADEIGLTPEQAVMNEFIL